MMDANGLFCSILSATKGVIAELLISSVYFVGVCETLLNACVQKKGRGCAAHEVL